MSLPGQISLLARQTAKLSGSAVTGVLPTSKGGTGINATVTGMGGASYGGVYPITLYAKSVTVLTAGSPADIATITIPSGITRWAIYASDFGGAPLAAGCVVVAETAAGTLNAAIFTAHSAAGGGGTLLLDEAIDLGTAGSSAVFLPSNAITVSSAGTLYIRQTANSANAGTVSFYITIYPLP